MEKTKGIIAVLIVFCLVVGALAGGLTAVILAGVREGDIGPMGLSGLDGLNGEDGVDGTDGGMGPRGYHGSAGPRGPGGGTGSTGATGPQGPPGEPCVCNEPPVITTNTSDSDWDGNFYFRISISVEDPENDLRIINLYHKHNEDDPWIRTNEIGGNPHGYFQHWYSNNNSDIFTEEHLVNYSPNECEEIWWLVEVDDGENLAIVEEYSQLCIPI